MNVILLSKVENLGGIGDQVSVKAGYARNFLIPSKRAMVATQEAIVHIESQRSALEAAAQDGLEAAKALGEQVAALVQVTLTVNASDEGKLYGSVAARDIIQALSEHGVVVEKNTIDMEGVIHQVGSHAVKVHLHADVRIPLTVVVQAKTADE